MVAKSDTKESITKNIQLKKNQHTNKTQAKPKTQQPIKNNH